MLLNISKNKIKALLGISLIFIIKKGVNTFKQMLLRLLTVCTSIKNYSRLTVEDCWHIVFCQQVKYDLYIYQMALLC